MPYGIVWLGEVPEHLGVQQLEYVAALNPKASEVRKLAPDTQVSFVPMEAVGEYGRPSLTVAAPCWKCRGIVNLPIPLPHDYESMAYARGMPVHLFQVRLTPVHIRQARPLIAGIPY